jgi:hypothetical protein
MDFRGEFKAIFSYLMLTVKLLAKNLKKLLLKPFLQKSGCCIGCFFAVVIQGMAETCCGGRQVLPGR